MLAKNQRGSYYLASLTLMLLLTGCAGTVKYMSSVPADEVVTSPMDGKSMVVFLRPSTLGFAIQSSVFEVKGETVSLVGIVAAKKMVSYQLDPGEHLFMVVGESADFMSTELEPNMTYYAFITPRFGVWKARFSLKPIHSAELSSSQLNECLKECEWVKNTPASENWANSNMASIQSKRKEYYAKWMSKDSNDRPKLLPQDGK